MSNEDPVKKHPIPDAHWVALQMFVLCQNKPPYSKYELRILFSLLSEYTLEVSKQIFNEWYPDTDPPIYNYKKQK